MAAHFNKQRRPVAGVSGGREGKERGISRETRGGEVADNKGISRKLAVCPLMPLRETQIQTNNLHAMRGQFQQVKLGSD